MTGALWPEIFRGTPFYGFVQRNWKILLAVVLGSILSQVVMAIAAARTCIRAGFAGQFTAAWALQTLVIGYPSLKRLTDGMPGTKVVKTD